MAAPPWHRRSAYGVHTLGLGIALLPAEHAFVHYNYPIDMHMIGAEMVADIHRARMHMPWTLSIGATNGLVSFPSFHAAIGVLMVWTMRGRNALSALVLVMNVLLILGTAFLGSHYVIDVIASLLMMPAILWAAQRLTRTAFHQSAAPSLAPRPAYSGSNRIISERLQS